jgi:hypothetical protein
MDVELITANEYGKKAETPWSMNISETSNLTHFGSVQSYNKY